MSHLSVTSCLVMVTSAVSASPAEANLALIGFSYSSVSDSGNIWRIDPTTGTTTSFATGYLSSGVVGSNFTVQGNSAYIAYENSLTSWNLTTGERTTSAFAQNLNALRAGSDGTLIGMSYSSVSDSGNIWRIDPTTGTTTSFATGYLAGGVVGSNFTVHANFAYATHENSLTRWNLITGERTTTPFAQYMNAVVAIPAPAAAPLLALAGLTTRGRRRR
jgi:hypothetical protein